MKKTMSRSVISLILAAAFLLGLGFLCVKYIFDADLWASQSYNPYMVSGQGLANAGDILDRNGVVLATSVDGERIYHEDETTRKAMLHTVGDGSYNIATAVETAYRDKISGHSKVFGYGLPQSLKGKNNLTVTLDSNVCTEVYQAFEGRNGACFVYNYKTGEVLCMVSAPTYDPMNIPEKPGTALTLTTAFPLPIHPAQFSRLLLQPQALNTSTATKIRLFTVTAKRKSAILRLPALKLTATLT